MATVWAYQKGLSRSQFILTGMGTFVLVLFVWDMLVARRIPKSNILAKPGELIERLGQIVVVCASVK